MKRDQRPNGFTLIETMLAVLVLSMVMTLVFTGFSQTSKNQEVVKNKLDRYQTIRGALERMSHELSTAFVSAQQNPNMSLRVVNTAFIGKDGMHGDHLDFTSFSHHRLYRDAHESDQNELSYFVTRDPNDSDKYVLVRREQSRIDEDSQKGGKLEILVEDVKDFQLKYLDTNNWQWIDGWDTTQPISQPNRLPAQVKVTLTVYETRTGKQREELTFGTRAALPIRFGLNHAAYNP